MKTTYLFTRKINKQEYKFYHYDWTKEESWTGEAHGCFGVETPDSDFGYPDMIMFSVNDLDKKKNICTIHRYLAPWKKRKCAEILEKNGYNPFSKDYMEF